MLATTIVGAVGAFLLVAGWLFVVDSTTAKGEAIKTGGLAGGAVIALYALWLNDRRRRTEEARQHLEGLRTDHDRSRVADERFARAVELLGHDADQVRVGALHALAGLAESSEKDYRQTVLNILCSYLRRPFELPLTAEADPERHRELEVRLTAQQLITKLLPHADLPDAPHYDLNLTNASVEYLDLAHRQVGQFVARSAKFYRANAFHHTTFHGDAHFTGAENHGRLYVHDSVFHGKAWFSNFASDDEVDFHATDFRGASKFAFGAYKGGFSLAGAKFATRADIRGLRVTGKRDLPAGWLTDLEGNA
ncbi:hypothetical protein RM788_23850 [Umezawaea sp. Da 62-37]|nr:hypothetical protein [Umezawaea sp. Da 62-37]WNV91923.1 hypothetical protein RM788_23850 [Umezawaea sp. Da 62-37]